MSQAPDNIIANEQVPASIAAEADITGGTAFDYQAPIDGPCDIDALTKMMEERNILSDEKLKFDEDFVALFYSDAAAEPGQDAMYNGEPEIWGKKYWDFLHILAYYYPDKPSDSVKRAAYQLAHSLRELLPCEKCRTAYRREIIELPIAPHLESRELFMDWVIELHSRVNERTGKPPIDVDALYTHLTTLPSLRALPEHHSATTPTEAVAKKRSTSADAHRLAATQKLSGGNTSQKQASLRSAQQSEKRSANVEKNNLAAPLAAARLAEIRRAQAEQFESLKRKQIARESVRAAQETQRKYGNLNPQQRVAVIQQERQKAARRIKKPGECKSCGSKKPVLPSLF